MTTFRIGVDIGGTFTDIVFLGSDGTVHVKKVSSTVGAYGRAIIEGIGQVFGETGIKGGDVAEIRHGTTVASNAILELKGARTGLITTKGFRDVLEIRTLRMPRLYDIAWDKPPPLVERYLRLAVDERVDTHGKVDRPLDTAEAEAMVDRLLAEGCEAIAICLINSFANPAHEIAIRDIVRRKAPDLPCCISFDVLPEIKEYERTSTTVVNAYVLPVVSQYLSVLTAALQASGMKAPLLLMQSNGGLTPAEHAVRLPVHIIESGPAAGVIGAQAVAAAAGLPDVVSFDMGGTTAKASLIEAGEVTKAPEFQVGGGILSGSRLLTGSGYTLKVPAIDLAEVGAGGGSIVSIDAGGSLLVGPHSAGAVPGPVCYDIGGTQPTVTDANVILGYLNPEYLVGGAVRLNADKARSVFMERIGTPMGLSLEAAAYGAYQIAASNMIRAIKAVSTERGRDPRGYTLVAFGGNGPLFAAAMAEAIGMKRILVPPSPGVFSAFGLLYADVEHHYSRTFRGLLQSLDVAHLAEIWEAMAREARDQLQADGYSGAQMRVLRRASLHYQGQTFELAVPAPDGPIDASLLAALEEAFHAEHERTYGHRAGAEEPVELVGIQIVGQAATGERRIAGAQPGGAASGAEERGSRTCWFGGTHGWLETPIIGRAALRTARPGPCIVEEYDATCVVPPGATAGLDAYGNIIVTLG